MKTRPRNPIVRRTLRLSQTVSQFHSRPDHERSVRKARTELTTRSDGTSGAFDCCNGGVNVFCSDESKPKMDDPARDTGAGSNKDV